MSEQHDDHIWLTVDGEAWAIKRVSWPLIQLWRGYEPELEYAVVNMSGFKADAYVAEADAASADRRHGGGG
jgi:hypothetical protein